MVFRGNAKVKGVKCKACMMKIMRPRQKRILDRITELTSTQLTFTFCLLTYIRIYRSFVGDPMGVGVPSIVGDKQVLWAFGLNFTLREYDALLSVCFFCTFCFSRNTYINMKLLNSLSLKSTYVTLSIYHVFWLWAGWCMWFCIIIIYRLHI